MALLWVNARYLSRVKVLANGFWERKNIIINDIEYCPYHPDGIVKRYKKKSAYRKPGNMMIKKIHKKWNIDINKSFMIGDKKIDMIASQKAGLRFIRKRYNLMREVKKKLSL